MTGEACLDQTTMLDHQLRRIVTVSPGMCSGSSLFYGRIGDWTWETVSKQTGMSVYRAKTKSNQAAYFSFFYFCTESTGRLTPHSLEFGDQLDVTSTAFSVGGQSVVTLHRLCEQGAERAGELLTPEEFYDNKSVDCIYVQNVNRWIGRTKSTNDGLVESLPRGFNPEVLPALPRLYSPRAVTSRARKTGTLLDVPLADAINRSDHGHEHVIDLVHDVNAAGLTYFAAYFAIADEALMVAWLDLGRSCDDFISRNVAKTSMVYFANPNPGDRVLCRTRIAQCDDGREYAEIQLKLSDSSDPIALCLIEIRGSRQ